MLLYEMSYEELSRRRVAKVAGERQTREMHMAAIFTFARRWNKWYRVLRHSKDFGPLDSMRYGLWLARS